MNNYLFRLRFGLVTPINAYLRFKEREWGGLCFSFNTIV